MDGSLEEPGTEGDATKEDRTVGLNRILDC